MYLKFISRYAFLLTVMLSVSATAAFAQFNIKIPKIDKPKPDNVRITADTTKTGNGTASTTGKGKSSSNLVYGPMRPTGTPQLIKSSIYVQAQTHNEY